MQWWLNEMGWKSIYQQCVMPTWIVPWEKQIRSSRRIYRHCWKVYIPPAFKPHDTALHLDWRFWEVTKLVWNQPQRIQRIYPETQIFGSHPLCSVCFKGPGLSTMKRSPLASGPPWAPFPKASSRGFHKVLIDGRAAAHAPSDSPRLQGALSIPPRMGSSQHCRFGILSLFLFVLTLCSIIANGHVSHYCARHVNHKCECHGN